MIPTEQWACALIVHVHFALTLVDVIMCGAHMNQIFLLVIEYKYVNILMVACEYPSYSYTSSTAHTMRESIWFTHMSYTSVVCAAGVALPHNHTVGPLSHTILVCVVTNTQQITGNVITQYK